MRPPYCGFKLWTCRNILDQCVRLVPFCAADWPREEQNCVQSPSISSCPIQPGKNHCETLSQVRLYFFARAGNEIFSWIQIMALYIVGAYRAGKSWCRQWTRTACLLDYNGILSFHGSTHRLGHRLFLHDAQRWTLPEGKNAGGAVWSGVGGCGIGKNQWELIQQWRWLGDCLLQLQNCSWLVVWVWVVMWESRVKSCYWQDAECLL